MTACVQGWAWDMALLLDAEGQSARCAPASPQLWPDRLCRSRAFNGYQERELIHCVKAWLALATRGSARQVLGQRAVLGYRSLFSGNGEGASMSDLTALRPALDDWVSANYPGGYFAAGGGQRLVYRVPRGESESALKVWQVAGAVQHERHVREVSALARITHVGLPRVVHHLSQVELEGFLLAFYEEEWLDARSLGQRLESNELPLDTSESRTFLQSALDVLAALHREHIVHRDISPGNVLWDGSQAFLIDLGIAKHLNLTELTATGAALPLTRATASPEQLEGVASGLRETTDVFSLGVVAFIAVVGQHPFMDEGERLDVAQLVRRQHNGDVRGRAPGDLGSLLHEMLEPVSFYRPSAAALLQRF